MKARLYLCTAASIALAGGAYGQTPTSSPSGAATVPAGSPSNTDQGLTLQEIVVTAERRAESLQKVPVAITAVTGEALANAGITQPVDLPAVVTGLNISPGNGPVAEIYIRGVGTSINNTFGDNAVSFNVDGVNWSRATGLNGQFYDVARVEVLKGPQGTLYGRNATGGAINVITNHPDFEGYSGSFSVEGGNYSLGDTQGALNIPVSSDVAARVAGRFNYRDGYYSDGYDDDKSGSARAQLLYKPRSDLSVLFMSDFEASNEVGPGVVMKPFVEPSNPWLGGSTPLAQQDFRNLAKPLPLAPLGNDGFERVNNFGLSAEANWTTSLGTLTVLPAFRNLYDTNRNYTGGFYITTREKARQESGEIRLASDNTLPLSYVVGTFIAHENRGSDQYVNQTITASYNEVYSFPDDADSVFGQIQYRLSQRLRLTGGARYTHETKSLDGAGITSTGVVTPYLGDNTYNNVSWRAGAEYDVSSDSLLYANVGTGFKAGGFFSGVKGDNTYKPEVITAYTLGSKNTFLDGRLRVNGEAFYWDYKDHQEFHLGLNSAGAVAGLTTNVGKATIEGVDAEIDWAAWKRGSFIVRAEYLDAVFNTFSYLADYPALPPNTGCTTTLIKKGYYNINCNGKAAGRSPKFASNISFRQGVQLPSGDLLTGTVGIDLASSQYMGDDYTQTERQAAYGTVDLGLQYQFSNSNWSISAWARNIGDTAVMSLAIEQVFAPKITIANLRPPRTFGGKVSYDF